MRELRDREICILEEQGCMAEDWSDILVSDDFTTDTMHNVALYGHVELGSMMGSIEVEEGFLRRCGIRNVSLRNVCVGDDCLIENIHGYICGYNIGNHCLLTNIGTMTCQEDATFGQGKTISVLNEGGKGNVTLCEELTAQIAWMMINFPDAMRRMKNEECRMKNEECGTHNSIGSYARIVNAKDIRNVKIGDYCEIQGASRLDDCTIMSNEDACTFIGTDAVIKGSVIAPGATVTDGAKVYECFVGESVHVGKGFSAEASLFFANSYMDNGEACAALCGPFSTSHHKSTLLIGGAFSFYNAGSATNQSNHAYKMGPIHWGMLDRGAKTASGCHILWPAHIGAFSMAMGKIQTHPQVHAMPFSYIIADGNKTYLVPGINIRTVGTWRDINKWRKRDLRPLSSRNDIINFAFPNPYLIQNVLEGRRILKDLLHNSEGNSEEQSVQEYAYNGTFIKHDAAVRGIRFYDLIIRLFLFEYYTHKKVSDAVAHHDRWFDIFGMLTPKHELDTIIHDISTGDIDSLSTLQQRLQETHDAYPLHCAEYAEYLISILSEEISNPDTLQYQSEQAHDEWLNLIARDAEKEYQMGDVDKETLDAFLNSLAQ
ncbi:MAG: DUF4954 family protein [Bacteroidaceae bacterium]|nr:DUF4954 family protein [Bacteroidaceae bacterium]